MSKQILFMSTKFRDDTGWVEEFLASRDCVLAKRDFKEHMTEDELCEVVKDIDGIITGLHPITPKVFDAANRLKVISAQGVGYDHIDTVEASKRGIAVCICAGCNNHSVSELAFGFMLNLARDLQRHDKEVREGKWIRYMGTELWGKTLGIVGMGRVGKSTALLAKAFGMRVLVSEINWDITFAAEHGLSYAPLHTLLQESDFVTLHVPLNDSTRGLIDEKAIELMKPSAFLINTARGPIVKESALVNALKTKRIAGAALDVFEVEPHPNNPYLELDNVILAPHIGGTTRSAGERAVYLALVNVTNVVNGLPAHCQVNEFTTMEASSATNSHLIGVPAD